MPGLKWTKNIASLLSQQLFDWVQRVWLAPPCFSWQPKVNPTETLIYFRETDDNSLGTPCSWNAHCHSLTWQLNGLCHGQKCLQLFSDSGKRPLDIAAMNAELPPFTNGEHKSESASKFDRDITPLMVPSLRSQKWAYSVLLVNPPCRVTGADTWRSCHSGLWLAAITHR